MYRMKITDNKREQLEYKMAKIYKTDAIGFAYMYRR
jgi:hypothetical protein